MSRIADALARASSDRGRASADEDHGDPWGFEGGAASLPESGAVPLPVVERTKVSPAIEIRSVSRLPRSAECEYSERLVTSGMLPVPVVEQYRSLAATLHEHQLKRHVRVTMITSALPGEGKSLVASNLALVLSGSFGRRVLLVDGDLRRPCLHRIFGVENTAGIAGLLEQEQSVKVPVIALSDKLSLVVTGPPSQDPLRIVTSDAMRAFLERASAAYDWVIVDTPPVAMLSDANLLAAMVDAVLFVVRAGKTPYEAVQKAIDTIGKDRIIGAVLNHAAARSTAGYSDAYYSADYTAGDA